MPLIMGQHMLFFNKKVSKFQILIHFTRPRRKNVQQRKIKGTEFALPHHMVRFSIKEHNAHR